MNLRQMRLAQNVAYHVTGSSENYKDYVMFCRREGIDPAHIRGLKQRNHVYSQALQVVARTFQPDSCLDRELDSQGYRVRVMSDDELANELRTSETNVVVNGEMRLEGRWEGVQMNANAIPLTPEMFGTITSRQIDRADSTPMALSPQLAHAIENDIARGLGNLYRQTNDLIMGCIVEPDRGDGSQ